MHFHVPRQGLAKGVRSAQGGCAVGGATILAPWLAFHSRECDFRSILGRSRFLAALGRAPSKTDSEAALYICMMLHCYT
jgi:hypothetical protein